MSIAEEIRNIAYELLNARGEFSIEDVREKLNEKNIFSDSKNASLRVTISQMVKKDPHIVRIERGKYKYTAEILEEKKEEEDKNKDEEEMDDWKITLDNAEREVNILVKQIAEFNWLDCKDNEIEYMRNVAQQLKQFQKNITKAIQQMK